jgi:hypothetical protein
VGKLGVVQGAQARYLSAPILAEAASATGTQP